MRALQGARGPQPVDSYQLEVPRGTRFTHVAWNTNTGGNCFFDSIGGGMLGEQYQGAMSIRRLIADRIRSGVVEYVPGLTTHGMGSNDDGASIISASDWADKVDGPHNNDITGGYVDQFTCYCVGQALQCNIVSFFAEMVDPNNFKSPLLIVATPYHMKYNPEHPTLFVWHTGGNLGSKANTTVVDLATPDKFGNKKKRIIYQNHFQLLGEQTDNGVLWKQPPMRPELLLQAIIRATTAIYIDCGRKKDVPHRTWAPIWRQFDEMKNLCQGGLCVHV